MMTAGEIEALVAKHFGPHLAIAPTPRYEAVVRNFVRALTKRIEELEARPAADDAEQAIRRISVILGGTDEWADRDTMLWGVVQTAEEAARKIMTVEPYDIYLTEFVETMKWSPETPEDVRSLVLCNLQGFVAFLKEAVAGPPFDTGPLSPDDQQRIDKALNAHVAEPFRSTLNAFNAAETDEDSDWHDCSGVVVLPNGHFADGSENNVEIEKDDPLCRHGRPMHQDCYKCDYEETANARREIYASKPEIGIAVRALAEWTIENGYDAFTWKLTNSENDKVHVSVKPSTPEARPAADGERPVEWLWYGEDASGERHFSFGRWQSHPCQHRYKYADIQPTERAEALEEGLRVIAGQAHYEFGETRESLENIIDACREVASSSLAKTGGAGMSTLKSLRERLALATGPDGEIDRDIHFALIADRAVVFGHGGWEQVVSKPVRPDEPAPWEVMVYTKSTDAALALVEHVLPGWFWRAGHVPNIHWVDGHGYEHWAHLSRTHASNCDRNDEATGWGNSVPLAILLATVDALIAREGQP